MSNFLKKAAAAVSFAHLAGIGRNVKASEDDEDKKEQDREDGNAKKSKAADDDDKKDDEYAEDEADENQLSADDDSDPEDDKEKKSKKAKSAADDEDADDEDDKDEEMRGKSAAANARRRERARCAAIFATKAAARNPVLAAKLAFQTSMPRSEAIAVLEGTPAAVVPDRGKRADRNPDIGAGGGGEKTTPQAVASRWDAAFKKVGHR